MSKFQARRAVEVFEEDLHECSIRKGRENASCDEEPRDHAAGGRGGVRW